MLTTAILLFAACTPARAQGKAPDACSVVTKAEIEQTFGVKLENGTGDKPAAGPVVSSCVFSTADGAASVSLGLVQDPPDSKSVAQAALPGMKPRAIAGVGTEAFVIDVAGMGSQLTAYRGRRVAVQVAASGIKTDAKATEAGLVKIAKLLLERWK